MLDLGTGLTAPGITLAIATSPSLKQSVPPSLNQSDRIEFLRECRQLFWSPLEIKNLLAMSGQLQEQLREKMQSSNICMLPSYNYTLPTGRERGSYLALDIGGSTCRVALIELSGRDRGQDCVRIVKMNSYRIGNAIKALKGHDFFDWIASKIAETLEDPAVLQLHKLRGTKPLSMGLAWSFPIQETSMGVGTLLEMGKGFQACVGVLGQDVNSLIMRACEIKHLNVRLDAIINDGEATLLTREYQDDAICFSLILGTGINMAVMLPVAAFAHSKFGSRPQMWYDQAKHVLVNTEYSMFGKGVLPLTRWDDCLDRTHNHPHFQPLEYLTGGRYLGEIVRLVLVEAIQTVGLFDGRAPKGLLEPYALEASTDDSPTLSKSSSTLQRNHPLTSPLTISDLRFVQQICRIISHRAAAYLATGVHAMWELRTTVEGLKPSSAGHVTIGCNGSVIEEYPNFRQTAQKFLDELVELSGGEAHSVVLMVAHESSIFGAAIAACVVEHRALLSS